MNRLALVDLLRDPAALVILKATLVLSVASVAGAGMKRFSAARRHMVWLVALASCAWLVLSSPVVPAIVIHTPMLARSVFEVAARPIAEATPVAQSASAVNASRASAHLPATNVAQRRSGHMPKHPLIALWVIGFAALLARHVIGFVGTMRLARRASIVNDDHTARELASIACAVGTRRDVRLGYSTEVQTPITFDVVKPYVLLPEEAKSWSAERRRAVLVHEAAHIARGDWLSQAIGQLTCELFWFHPLAWRAFAHLRDEAERAADDVVLRSGMRAVDYATHLLDLADHVAHSHADLVAVGIVSTTDLERRFVAMFDATRSRAIVSARTRAVGTSVALAVACPLASLRVAAPMQRVSAPLPHVSAHHEASVENARVDERSSVRVAPVPAVHAMTVREPATIAAISAVPSPIVRPNFSGKWTQDTVAGAQVDNFTTDWSNITQTPTTISFESRSHGVDASLSSSIPNLRLDGTQGNGAGMLGNTGMSLVARALWEGDTLVVTTYAIVTIGGGLHDLLTTERMTLSADGNTLYDTSLSRTDGRLRWGGPQTFVLRRMAP